jgi:hypothetical protein
MNKLSLLTSATWAHFYQTPIPPDPWEVLRAKAERTLSYLDYHAWLNLIYYRRRYEVLNTHRANTTCTLSRVHCSNSLLMGDN